jgi:methyl-accepting chemotaxis protein
VTTEQRLDNIDNRLAALLAVAEVQQGDITTLTENIAAVNHQTELLVSGMGQVLKGITEFRADMAELKELTQQQGDRIERIAQTFENQAETTARLVRIVEQLLSSRNE